MTDHPIDLDTVVVQITSTVTPAVMKDQTRTFLLLDTQAIEDWAYPGMPPDARHIPYAPSVTELVREVAPLSPRRWLWEDSELQEYRERGPLLVETTLLPELISHFIEHWAPVNGGMLIGSRHTLDQVQHHLASLVKIGLPDGGQARFKFNANNMSSWLRAFNEFSRAQWMGLVTRMVWRETAGPAHAWYAANNPAVLDFERRETGWFQLGSHALADFDANVRDQLQIDCEDRP